MDALKFMRILKWMNDPKGYLEVYSKSLSGWIYPKGCLEI